MSTNAEQTENILPIACKLSEQELATATWQKRNMYRLMGSRSAFPTSRIFHNPGITASEIGIIFFSILYLALMIRRSLCI